MKYIITKASPTMYTYEEIRKFHELREKVNQKKIVAGREVDVIDRNTLDEFIVYAQSEDPEVRNEGRNGLRNVLLVGSTILVVSLILRKVRSIYRTITTALYNAALQRIVRQNVGLIRSIPITKRVALVRTIISLGQDRKTIPFLTLKEILVDSYNLSESEANRVALDQARKFEVAVRRAEQEIEGIRQYVWETMKDDRVRDTHVANQGRIFSWDTPSPITGHPGDDPNCRCEPIPVISRKR